jgi:hypothetical protein
MDEATAEPHAGFARIQSILSAFRAELARFAAI